MLSNSAAHESWIKDGTVEAAPVTESTPADVVTPALESVSTPEQTSAPTPTGTESEVATPVDASVGASVPAPTVEEFLTGRVGDQEYKIPKNVQLPWKRRNETGFAPIEEVLSSNMMERDYRKKTQSLADDRRALLAEQAKFTARETAAAAERKMYEDAMRTDEGYARYTQHRDALEHNPVYKANWEKGLKADELEAENNVYRSEAEQALLVEATQSLASTLLDVAKEYPDVDPERVRATYSEALKNETADISLPTIHQFFKQEAQSVKATYDSYETKHLAPLRSELSAKDAALKALESRLAALEHNEKTDKALAGRKAVAPAITTSGNAIVTSRTESTRKPFTSDEYASVKSDWMRGK